MTPKTSTHFRLSEATVEKLAALADRYGTRTTAVAVAIDRLFREEGLLRRCPRCDYPALVEIRTHPGLALCNECGYREDTRPTA